MTLKKQTKIILGIIIIVAGILFFIRQNKNITGSAVEQLTVAECLSSKGVEMYGAYWCSHCANQKKVFGNSFKYINYIECTEEKAKCAEQGIQGYPTWIINGEKYVGEKSLETLKQLSGC